MTDISKLQHFKEATMAAINDLAADNKDVLMLDADLKSCIGSNSFENKYPKRFFNCGIAEANMVGVAAGLSSMGFVPFAHSFGIFASRRAYDQWFLSVNYAKQRVHLIGSDPGITAQLNGGTHMPFEDIALMRQVPDLVVYEPSDAYSTYELIKQAYFSKKSSYLRVPRKGISFRYDANTKFELGKGIELEKGNDIAIFATGGFMVDLAQETVKELKANGYNPTLIDLHTIKPLDIELIEKVAKRCGKIIVCENGRYAGGVGEGIAAHLATTHPVLMDFLNVGEKFGEVGKLDYLAKAFDFTKENLYSKCVNLIKK